MRLAAIAAVVLAAAAAPASAIVGGTPTSSFEAVANGVQFTANWVLTARHVTSYVQDGPYSNGYGSATIAKRYNGPGDLALLRLKTPIAAPVLALEATLLPTGDRAMPAAATITTGRNQVPRGYGYTQVRAVIDHADYDGPGGQPPVAVSLLVTYTDGMGPPYVESLDSGGGLFVGHVTDATTALWGITSAQLVDDTRTPAGHASAFVQLAAYRSWIDATMAGDSADSQMALWVSSVPEPHAALLLLAGLPLLLARRAFGRPRAALVQPPM